ncbi:MAG: restriction endonuclease subunit S [Bacilli bacterium]
MSKLEELIQKLCPNGVKYRKVGEICLLTRGVVMSKDFIRGNPGDYPVYSSQTENNGELGKINTYAFDGEYLTWTTDGANAGTVFYRNDKFSVTNVCGVLTMKHRNITNAKYLYYALQTATKPYVNKGMGNAKLMSNVMAQVSVSVPPIEVQHEIVRILDNFTKLTAELTAELTARKKQYEFYRDNFLSFKNDLKKVPLWKITNWDKKFNSVERHKQEKVITYKNLLAKDLFALKKDYGDVFLLSTGEETGWTTEELAGDNLSIGEVVAIPWGKSRPVSEVMKYYKGKFVTADNRIATSKDINILSNRYLYFWMKSQGKLIDSFYRGSSLEHPDMNKVLSLEIPLPSISEQQRIVDILDKFDAYCNDLSLGLPAEIAARQKQYEYYRDKLLTFKELKA